MSQRLDELIAQLQERDSAYSGHYAETVDAAINELVDIVMDNPGPGREPGIPTRGEANLLFWLERCKTKHCVDKPLPPPDPELVVRQTATGREIDNYPSKPYITPPLQATVHMPDGTTQRWGKQRLRETGAMVGNGLPYDYTRFGAELHYDPTLNRVHTVHGPGFNHEAHQDWLRHY